MKLKTALLAGLLLTLAVFLNSQTRIVPEGSGSGTVTSIATTGPLSGGTITGSGTLSCPTCVTSAAALTSGNVIIGGGSQASSASNVTLTNPATSATLTIIDGTTLTGPAATDTLVGRASTDTLTNKTLTSPAITTPTGLVTSDISPFDKTVTQYVDDFVFGTTSSTFLGDLGWTRGSNLANPTITHLAAENEHSGILRITTSANATDVATMYNNSQFYGISQKTNWKMQWLVRIVSLTQGKYFFGFTSSTNAPNVNAMGAWLDTTVVGDVWQLYTEAATSGSPNLVSSGVTCVANTWHLLTLDMTTAGTVRLSVDGAAVVTSSTKVPAGTIAMTLYAYTVNTVDATQNTVDYDLFQFRKTGITR